MTTPFPQSRCHQCAFVREVKTPRSTFLMCTGPQMPKYVPQPVVSCGVFQPRAAQGAEPPPNDEPSGHQ